MSRKQHIVLVICSALLAIAVAYLLYVFQIRQVALQETVQIVAANEFVDSGTLLTESILGYKSIPAFSFEDGMVTDMEQVIGKENWIPLGKGEPIQDWKLNSLSLYPSQHQSTFQIPKDYLLSVASGIRAGDEVLIYISSLLEPSQRLFEEPVVVSSVRTSANQEVDDLEHSMLDAMAEGNEQKLYASRREPNGKIEYINLNLTEEQWLKIDQLCKDGERRLVIAYKSSFAEPQRKEEASL